MLRVVVVDDSATARECLVQILSADPDIRVVGVAKNGLEGVRLTQQLLPNVVTMDIQMPVMNGFEATREIMITSPRPIVIISSSTRATDSENAMRALNAGALTLIAKPEGPGTERYELVAKQLLETVKTMADVKVIRRRRRADDDHPELTHVAPKPARQVKIIAIAASTGGPPALQTVLGKLPKDFPTPILVVQHLAPGFIDGLASWLDSSLDVRVKIAESGEALQPGQVYIAPDDRHLGTTKYGEIYLSKDPAMDGFRPSANFLFDAVAKAFGGKALAVIMTGMGRDGVRGLRAVHEAGGRVIAQDALSCVVNGMPGAAVAAKVVDEVLDLEGIANALQVHTSNIC